MIWARDCPIAYLFQDFCGVLSVAHGTSRLSPRASEEEPDDADDFVHLQLGAREGLEQLALPGTESSASNVPEKGSLCGWCGGLNWKNGEETQLDGKHDGLRWKSFHCQTCEYLTYLDISKSIKHKHLRMNIYRSKSLNPRFGVDAGIARRLESRGDCDGRLSAREGRKLVLA